MVYAGCRSRRTHSYTSRPGRTFRAGSNDRSMSASSTGSSFSESSANGCQAPERMAHASASVVASWNTADNSTAPAGVRYGSNVVMGLPYGEPAGVSVKRVSRPSPVEANKRSPWRPPSIVTRIARPKMSGAGAGSPIARDCRTSTRSAPDWSSHVAPVLSFAPNLCSVPATTEPRGCKGLAAGRAAMIRVAPRNTCPPADEAVRTTWSATVMSRLYPITEQTQTRPGGADTRRPHCPWCSPGYLVPAHTPRPLTGPATSLRSLPSLEACAAQTSSPSPQTRQR